MGEEEQPAVVRIYAGDSVDTPAVTSFAIPPTDPPETRAVLRTWRTELSLVVRGRVPQSLVAELLAREVEQMDRAASRFREDSELSSINDNPGSWVRVSGYLGALLDCALESAELTDGLCDPGLGAAVDAAGYRQWRDGATPRPQPGAVGNWRDIERRGDEVRIPPGMHLDLGAVAKGWLADRVAFAAAERFGAATLANMGGDLRALTAEEPWVVTVDPEDSQVPAQSLRLWDAGLATSGIGRRRWQTTDGHAAHHIIDPRTGSPAETPWLSCSVVAATAAQANAASTAVLVLGDSGPEWLDRQGLDGWFVGVDGRQRRVGRWPQRA